MKTEHKQALQWMLDGKEVQVNYDNWTTCSQKGLLHHILNDSGAIFRLKPRTITVNGREVQAPETVTPTGPFFCADPFKENFYSSDSWCGAEGEQLWLERGLVHLTKEAAIAHAKAMLNID